MPHTLPPFFSSPVHPFRCPYPLSRFRGDLSTVGMHFVEPSCHEHQRSGMLVVPPADVLVGARHGPIMALRHVGGWGSPPQYRRLS